MPVTTGSSPGAALVALVLLGGCTPYLQETPIRARSYTLTRRCTQGPFTFQVPLRGARWGERIVLLVDTPRKLALKVDVRYGTVRLNRSLGGIPENSWCKGQAGDHPLTKPDASAAGKKTSAGNLVPRAAGTTRHPPVSSASRGALVTIVPLPGRSGSASRFPRSTTMGVNRYHSADNNHHLYTIPIYVDQITSRHAAPRAKGLIVKFTVWSTEPNDLEGVTFEVVHTRYEPTDAKKWDAQLREREEKARWHTKSARRRRENHEKKMRRARLKICYVLPRRGRQLRLCRQFNSATERRRCVLRGPRDVSCWGDHLTSVTRTWLKPSAPSRKVVAPHPPAPAPVRRRPDIRPPAARSTPGRVTILPPKGPPPLPPREQRSPKPSRNAAWVHGFYKWNGAKWIWFGGFWRIPQKDVDQGRTSKAPRLPPPSRTEKSTPPPYPGAFFVKGHWMWSGASFVWVPGRWVLPRDHGMRWVSPHWRVTRRGILFVPGRWKRR